MGYEDTRKKILETLMQRPNGTEIQPEKHQDFALSLLEYIRDVELISASTLIGIANEDTVPVLSENYNLSYIAGVAQQRTVEFKNFIDKDGKPISVTTGEMEGKLVILLWNRKYWDKQEISTNITSKSDNANFFYNIKIRKTYSNKDEMDNDSFNPLGNDNQRIKVGELVSVKNETDNSENAIYSYEYDIENNLNYWKFQMNMNVISDRIIDGGRADTMYGGALIIDGGTA